MRMSSSIVGGLLTMSALLGAAAAAATPEPVQLALSYEQRDDRTAFIDRVRKARLGEVEAQWDVASTYASLGEPVRALPMLHSAAAAGHPRAAALLGCLHEEGRGTERNLEEAKRWYGMAAERDQADAMAALGRLLLQENSPLAREAASQWFHKAAQREDPNGQYYVGWLLAQRSGAAGADADAYGWFLKAARQGHVGAQIAVATHLLNGQGVAKDRKAAGEWLARAADSQDSVARYLLGRLREEAGGDLDGARSSYRVAARAGHREAQFALAALLAKSNAEADRKEAAEWFGKAREAGHKEAANRLGELYRDSRGVLQQADKARIIFQQAAAQGHVNAMYNLARMQDSGLGGQRDTENALEWYARAAEAGHEKATEVLDGLLGGALKTSGLGLKGFWQ